MDPNCFISKTAAGNIIAKDVATVNCLPSLIRAGTNGFLIFAGTTALFIIVWGSIRLITSGGDAKQIDSARRMITFSIVGLIIVLSSFAIVNFIGYLTRSTDCITNLDSILTGCR